MATLQQKFQVGSPTHIKVQRVPGEQAPRVLEASTMSIRGEVLVSQILDTISPLWAPALVLALHVALGLRDPMAPCTPQELIRTPCVPEHSLVVWTDQHA